MNPKLLKFHHFGIEVKDIDVAIDFYVNILGFKVCNEKTYSEAFNETFVMIDLDGGILELITSHNKTIDFRKPPTRFHLAFETHNFNALLERVREKKVPVLKEPITVNKDVRLMTILDPDNNTIDIGQLQ